MQKTSLSLSGYILEAARGRIREVRNWRPCYERIAAPTLRDPEYVPRQGLDGLRRGTQVNGSRIPLPRSTFSGYIGDTHGIGQHVLCASFDILHRKDGNGVLLGLEIVDIEAARHSQR